MSKATVNHCLFCLADTSDHIMTEEFYDADGVFHPTIYHDYCSAKCRLFMFFGTPRLYNQMKSKQWATKILKDIKPPGSK